MRIPLNSVLCKIIDANIYSQLKSVTKEEYYDVLTGLFQDEVALKIETAMKQVFNRRIQCDEMRMEPFTYHNYGRWSFNWENDLTNEEIQDILSEYITNSLGTSFIHDMEIELNDIIYNTIEENRWRK